MLEKKSPQEVYQALRQVLVSLSPEARSMYQHLPEQWEDLSLSNKQLLQDMTWKMNLIISEFEPDEKKP